MPLTRFNVTDHSRYMIPIFPVFAAGLGISWTFSPPSTLKNTPVFRLILDIAPNWVWGLIYLSVAIVMIYAVLQESRRTYIVGIIILQIVVAAWGIANAIAFVREGATFSSWMWSAFVVYAAYVTGRGIQLRESEPLT